MESIFFTRGVPARESIPVESLAKCAQDVILASGLDILQYAPAAGYLPLRKSLATKKKMDDSRVFLAQGSLQILDILLHCRLHPGDTVAVEQPTYDRVLTLMRRAHLEIVPIDLQSDGLDVEKLEKELNAGVPIRLLYVIPDFQNPSGISMSLEKRRRLVELSLQFGFCIVEDSPYRNLRYAGEEIPSIFDLSPESVIQLSSYSKLISPGLRVGYAFLPPDMVGSVNRYAEDTYINASYLNHAIVHRFIQDGLLDEHLLFLKGLYGERLRILLAALQENMEGIGSWTIPQGGFFVGLWVNEKYDLSSLISRAAASELHLSAGHGFFMNGGEYFIRLPFCALTPENITTGIARLRQLILE